MKDPAFLFYPNDWIGGTMGMTFEEKGAYMELLMLQFNRGHMTSHMIGHTVGQLWVKIEDKFKVDADGLYFNERLEEEQKKRKAFSGSRRNNLKGENQYTKNRGHMGGHMTSHMENVNVNENSTTLSSVLNKRSNTFCFDFLESSPLKIVFLTWFDFKKKSSPFKTQESIEASFKILREFSGDSVFKANEIVTYNIAAESKSLFLKEEKLSHHGVKLNRVNDAFKDQIKEEETETFKPSPLWSQSAAL